MILLLWMLMGIAAFAMDRMMTPEAIAALPEGQRAFYDARPQWIVIVSLVTVCLQMGYTLFVMDGIGKLGAATAVPFPLTICLIGAFAVWFSMNAKKKGWLG